MRDIYLLLGLVCAMSLTFPQSISAQTKRQRLRTEVMHMTLPEQQQAQEDFARRYPLVANLTRRGLTHGRALKKSHASASRDTNQPL